MGLEIDFTDKKHYPMGITATSQGFHVSVTASGASCSLLLFAAGSQRKKPDQVILFPEELRWGDVWQMSLKGELQSPCEYCFEVDGKLMPDPYGHRFSGHEKWGQAEQIHHIMRCPVPETCEEEFDWEEDHFPGIPYEDAVIYRIHTRGFTKHVSSRAKHRGTFEAVLEKLPYLKSLGVTTIELMPVAEFEEIMMPDGIDGNPYGNDQPTGKINYWGYGKTCMFAPKRSFSATDRPDLEFKELVKAFHKEGMEVVIELFFSGKENPCVALDAVRFWVQEYHVDGIHLVGAAPTALIGQDPYLMDTKLWANGWDGVPSGGRRHLAEYNDGFQIDMRKVLKGDEEQINPLIFRTRRNPRHCGVINYIANTNGFTLRDMVCYDVKHNEANGEKNQDGTDYNYSWNCGVEGSARKKKILELRKKQVRNALLLVFLSQGTPLLLGGDEFGNSKKGNNNSYCQDNETSWLNWTQLQSHEELTDFVRHVIAFRKAHRVFHQPEEPKVMDYKACGCPDVSYHGVRAWVPEFENFRRQLGIMYCGEYGIRNDGTKDDYFFVAYNMHWEAHDFALPNLPRDRRWFLSFNTDDSACNGYYPEGQEPLASNQKQFKVPPRTIVVFAGRIVQEKAERP